MVKSMFAAVAGLRSHQSKMDVIGNNIANVNTYGFKTARATFRDVFYVTNSGAADAGEIYGGTNPSQVGYGAKLGSIDSLMTGGGTASTDNPTDCMIQGNGFFLVGLKPSEISNTQVRTGMAVGVASASTDNNNNNNNNQGGDDNKDITRVDGVDYTKAGAIDQDSVMSLNFTRVGIFNFDGAGNLVDSNGRMVYGFQAEYKVTGDSSGTSGSGTSGSGTNTSGTYEIALNKLTAIRLPNKNAANASAKYEPMELKNITIGADGTIIGVNDKNQTVKVGQIALANVPNPNALERQEDSYYTAKANTGVITVNPSGQNSTGVIKSGCLEMSNVDLSKEFTDMITTQRGFQANTRIITVTDNMLEELVNMKR